METLNTEKIIVDFLKYSIEHSKAYENGEYKKANKLHKELHKLYDVVKESNQTNIFQKFIKDENESVRFWAAVFTLKVNENESIRALEELSNRSNMKMTALTTLNLWKEGKLNLL